LEELLHKKKALTALCTSVNQSKRAPALLHTMVSMKYPEGMQLQECMQTYELLESSSELITLTTGPITMYMYLSIGLYYSYRQ